MLWQRGQRAFNNLRPRRVYDDRAHDETQRHQSQHRDAFFDYSKRPFPDDQPNHDSCRNRPPLETDAGGEFERDANTTDLGRQHQQTHEGEYQIEKRKVVETKTLANRVGYSAAADRREASSLFDQKDY